jgi:uncharacterized membrane protein YbhN (UPF0104 family)
MSERSERTISDQAEREALRAPPVRPVRIVLGLLGALAAGVVIVVTIGRLAGFSNLSDTLDGANPGWLVVCAVGQVVVFAGFAGALRHAIAFEGGPRIGPGLSARVVLASFGLSQLFAAGGAAGLAVTYWALRRVGMGRRNAAVRVIGLSTAVYLVFGLIGWMAALLSLVRANAPLGMTLPWLIGMPVILVAARWFTDGRRIGRWTTVGGGTVRKAFSTGVGAAGWVRRAAGDRGDGRAVLRWAGWYWVGDIASLWAALHAFDGDAGIVALTLVYTTGYLANSLPIPFVATGGMDAATTFALTTVGVPLEVALVSVVAHRVFAFWIPLIPGLVLAGLLRRTGNALTAAARQAAWPTREHLP